MIKKVILTTVSAAAVLAAGIGFSNVTANAATVQVPAQSYHYQPQTATNGTAPTTKTNQTVATTTTNSTTNTTTTSQATGATITEAAFESQGVVYLNGNKWTYYSGSTTADGTNISANGLDSNGYRVVQHRQALPLAQKL